MTRFNSALDGIPGDEETVNYPFIRQWAARAATLYTTSVYGSPEGKYAFCDQC